LMEETVSQYTLLMKYLYTYIFLHVFNTYVISYMYLTNYLSTMF
jgi:hypothetical protein